MPTVATDWYDKYRAVLRDDANGIDKVIRAIRHLRDKATTTTALKDLERELKFFRKHKRRMRYASLNARGYAIGSGVVEAANKVLVNQRMKRAGMRWSMRSERPHFQSIDKIRPFRYSMASYGRSSCRK